MIRVVPETHRMGRITFRTYDCWEEPSVAVKRFHEDLEDEV